MQGTVVDKLVLELRAETSQLRKDLNSVKSQLKGAESSSKGLNISLRQVATALAAVGAAQIVGSIIWSYSRFYHFTTSWNYPNNRCLKRLW